MVRLRRSLSILLACGSLLLARQGAAEEPTAKELAEQAYGHFVDEEYQKAIDLLEVARKKAPIPTINLIEARAYVKLGRFVEASRRYREAARWQLKPEDPKPFRQAIEDAKRELAQIEPKIAKLKLEVRGAPEAAARVKVVLDGVERDLLDTGMELNPGKHQLEVRGLADGDQSHTLTLVEGEAKAMSFDAGGPPPPGRNYVPAGVTFGASGAALLLGAIMGGLALGQKSELDERCPERRCEASVQSIHDQAVTYSWVSTVAFIVGGAGVTTGTFLAIFPPERSTSPASSAAALRLSVGADGAAAGLSLSF